MEEWNWIDLVLAFNKVPEMERDAVVPDGWDGRKSGSVGFELAVRRGMVGGALTFFCTRLPHFFLSPTG